MAFLPSGDRLKNRERGMDVSLVAGAMAVAGMGLAILAACFTASPAQGRTPKRDAEWVRSQLVRWVPGGDGSPPYLLRSRLEMVGDHGTTLRGVY
jgi:hypothetical protein